MEYLYCTLIGYFIGTFNPSFLIGKHRGMDIRTTGSGNAGASNALIHFGKAVGAACALFDIAKAWFAVFICRTLFAGFTQALAVAGTASILGHIFPVWLRFRGGKGLACLGGMILAFDWRVFLAILAAEIILVFITDYICFVSTTASVVFLAIYTVSTRDYIGALIFLAAVAAIFFRHSENFRRIRNGTELRFSYLWHPDEEKDRVLNNDPSVSQGRDA